jgi:hypothetical protein
VRKLFRLKEPLPWWVVALILAVLIQVPTLAVSYLLEETAQWQVLGLRWMAYLELGVFALVLARVDVYYLYENLDKSIFPAIKGFADLNDLDHVLAQSRSRKDAIIFTVFFTIFWSVSFSYFNAQYLQGDFIGYGLFLGTVVFSLCMGPVLYMMGWLFFLTYHMGGYEYDINQTAPAQSTVVQKFSEIYSTLLYSITAFVAFATFTVYDGQRSIQDNLGVISLTILIGWIPITLYFFVSLGSLRRIILKAKWQLLDRIKNDIMALHQDNIVDKDKLALIDSLMNYYSRVNATPNSTLNLGTSLGFLNQLAIPLVGIILANLGNIIDFLISFKTKLP